MSFISFSSLAFFLLLNFYFWCNSPNRNYFFFFSQDCHFSPLSTLDFVLFTFWKFSIILIEDITKDMNDADDTTLMAESEEELKNLLMRIKEESGKLT